MNFSILTIFVLAALCAVCTASNPLCETNACEASCVSRGFSSGECTTRFLCRCGKIETEVVNWGGCGSAQCFSYCFNKGYHGGRCSGSNCVCQSFRFY